MEVRKESVSSHLSQWIFQMLGGFMARSSEYYGLNHNWLNLGEGQRHDGTEISCSFNKKAFLG